MNRVGTSVVQEIKQRIPIEELIGSYLKLEKAGKSFKARCPFHNEKTASFFISPERGGYYCFGCNAKGDIFSFVEQFEGLDFKGALKVLADKAGVPLVYDQKSDSERDQIYDIMEESAKYFEKQLTNSKDASEYVKSRGLTAHTIADFRIGFAPDGWKNLLTYLKGKGWSLPIIEKAGLIKMGDRNDFYDRFRNRVMFPITDTSGRVIAFTGRILKDDGKSAKYLNSPDTPIFDKSMILFGLHKAKSEIRRMGYSILVEGQMDLIMSHQAGVKNAVASSGTALSDESNKETGIVSNLGLVRRLSPNIIIAMDSDSAGKKAAMRAVASTALTLGMSVKIADIEGGKDPADLILSDPVNWKAALRNAKHVVEFELGNVMKEEKDPHKLPASIRTRVLPLVAKIDSEMDKAFYVKMVGEKMGINEQAVWEDLRKVEKKDSSAVAPSAMGKSAKDIASSHRIDLVERRMFGLLRLMESNDLAVATEYRDRLRKISGDSYEERAKRVEPIMGDILFETESFYGNDRDRWPLHMQELLMNFEEDLISQELVSAMGRLKMAEKEGNHALVSELAKKCQVLSIRKAEVAKNKHR